MRISVLRPPYTIATEAFSKRLASVRAVHDTHVVDVSDDGVWQGRPYVVMETTGDTRIFLWGCAILWGFSALIHGLLLYPHYSHIPKTDFDPQLYIEYCLIAMAAAIAGTYFLFRLFNLIYGKLIAQEKTHRPLPDVLLYNVTAYCLGPSLLSIIPVAGPPLALLLIFIDLIIAGKKRLNIRATGAVIDALLPMIVIVALAFTGWFVGRIILHQVLNDPVQAEDADKLSMPALPR